MYLKPHSKARLIKRTSDHVRERMSEKYGAIANQEIYLNSTYLTTVSYDMCVLLEYLVGW